MKDITLRPQDQTNLLRILNAVFEHLQEDKLFRSENNHRRTRTARLQRQVEDFRNALWRTVHGVR